jgi:heat shock protein HslJ
MEWEPSLRTLRAFAGAAALVATVLGCQREPTAPEPAAVSARKELLAHCESEWTLVRCTDQGVDVALPKDARATLRCDSAGVVMGDSFVNHYSFMPPSGPTALFGEGTTTLMASSPELMAAEDRFMRAITDTAGVRLTDGRLVLSSKDGNVRLEFEKERAR